MSSININKLPSNKADKSDRDIATAAISAEVFVDSAWSAAKTKAFEKPDIYKYLDQKAIAELRIGAMARMLAEGNDVERTIWHTQQSAILDELDGRNAGAFNEVLFSITVEGRPVMSAPSDGDINDLPPGERDVVTTNSRIGAAAKYEHDAVKFLEKAQDIMIQRRQEAGGKYEGPENYATLLKYFADKARDSELFTRDRDTVKEFQEYKAEYAHIKQMVNEAVKGFLRTGDRDEPNIVEITNILSAITKMPPSTIDPRYVPGILRHTVAMMHNFSQKGTPLFINAINKLDTSECSEEAGLSIDLALRKGGEMQRSGDLRSALQAVVGLDPSYASKRAFRTVLAVRNTLEVATDLGGLYDISRLMKQAVDKHIDDPADLARAKAVAELAATRSLAKYRDIMVRDDVTPAQKARISQILQEIIDNAKSI